MEYNIIRSKRKTIAIEIKRDATVTVRAPYSVNQKRIDVFVESHRVWIDKNIKRISDMPVKNELSQQQLIELKQKAYYYIPKRVKYYSDIMGLKPSDVKINCAKTRYGSCSSKNSINFSCRVMLFPDYIVDYVIVHELAHIKYHNHKREFYSLIESYMPDYKERVKYIKSKEP